MEKKKNPGGRRPIISDSIQESIVNNVRMGAYMETAAAAAGISKDTLYSWLRKGSRNERLLWKAEDKLIEEGVKNYDDPEELRKDAIKESGLPKKELRYIEFSYAVNKAVAEGEINDVKIISEAATKTWQAAAWRLERRFPERYGRNDKVHTTVEGNLGVVSREVKDQQEYENAVASFFKIPGDINNPESEPDEDMEG